MADDLNNYALAYDSDDLLDPALRAISPPKQPQSQPHPTPRPPSAESHAATLAMLAHADTRCPPPLSQMSRLYGGGGGAPLSSLLVNAALEERARSALAAINNNNNNAPQPEDLRMAGLLSDWNNGNNNFAGGQQEEHGDDDAGTAQYKYPSDVDTDDEEEYDYGGYAETAAVAASGSVIAAGALSGSASAGGRSAVSSAAATSFAAAPSKGAWKVCTKPGCKHGKGAKLPLSEFANRRGEVVWKACIDCRARHAKSDREGRRRRRGSFVVKLPAQPEALRTLEGGGRIAEGGTDMMMEGGEGVEGGRRRSSAGFEKRNEDAGDLSWGTRVQKRRKSVQTTSLSRPKAGSGGVGGSRGQAIEKEEVAPEEGVEDSGTNSEEEEDKKRGAGGGRGKKGGEGGDESG